METAAPQDEGRYERAAGRRAAPRTRRFRLSRGSTEVYYSIMKSRIVSRDPEVMGGAVAFIGTRVPLQTLLDYLEAGESIDDFLEGFPSVSREQVIAFLDEARARAIEAAS